MPEGVDAEPDRPHQLAENMQLELLQVPQPDEEVVVAVDVLLEHMQRLRREVRVVKRHRRELEQLPPGAREVQPVVQEPFVQGEWDELVQELDQRALKERVLEVDRDLRLERQQRDEVEPDQHQHVPRDLPLPLAQHDAGALRAVTAHARHDPESAERVEEVPRVERHLLERGPELPEPLPQPQRELRRLRGVPALLRPQDERVGEVQPVVVDQK